MLSNNRLRDAFFATTKKILQPHCHRHFCWKPAGQTITPQSSSYNYYPSLVFLSSPVFTFSDIDKHHAAPAPASLKVRLFAE